MNISKLLEKKIESESLNDSLNKSNGSIDDLDVIENLKKENTFILNNYLDSISKSINIYGEKTFKNINQDFDVKDFKIKTNYNDALNISNEDMLKIIKMYQRRYISFGV